jgi:hypothetical protein
VLGRESIARLARRARRGGRCGGRDIARRASGDARARLGIEELGSGLRQAAVLVRGVLVAAAVQTDVRATLVRTRAVGRCRRGVHELAVLGAHAVRLERVVRRAEQAPGDVRQEHDQGVQRSLRLARGAWHARRRPTPAQIGARTAHSVNLACRTWTLKLADRNRRELEAPERHFLQTPRKTNRVNARVNAPRERPW